ncbi:leader peptidase (prepilin peptidase) / N-methyltransferase [Promicromonospora umidemergens]|uniref:Prepilin type IV endopeptidase peptidase domain-containing protein n=1 Tax=Promicromonospora umidemergens TaxID=629679 RepID=A0ABP8Y729_9MICO|nr:A24 family peptidase [Promicromonospora umidemergens]MCP2282599.1 leader peptidase (prepilin peptidase) / N-methyltransferase [Promicromonospora umidemergens]
MSPSDPVTSGATTPTEPFVVRQYGRARAEVRPYARAIGIAAVPAAGWAVWASGPGWLTPAYLVLAVVGAALAVIDARTHRLPNALVFPLTWATGVLLALAALGTGAWGSLGRAALGACAFFAVYQVLYLIAPRGGLGYGDVKLALSLGALLTWHSWYILLVGVFAAHIIAGAVAIVLLLGRRAGWRTGIAFGPYMLLGTVIGLTGARLIGW